MQVITRNTAAVREIGQILQINRLSNYAVSHASI